MSGRLLCPCCENLMEPPFEEGRPVCLDCYPAFLAICDRDDIPKDMLGLDFDGDTDTCFDF